MATPYSISEAGTLFIWWVSRRPSAHAFSASTCASRQVAAITPNSRGRAVIRIPNDRGALPGVPDRSFLMGATKPTMGPAAQQEPGADRANGSFVSCVVHSAAASYHSRSIGLADRVPFAA